MLFSMTSWTSGATTSAMIRVASTGRPRRRCGGSVWSLGALLLHRPWELDADALPPDVGVLAYQLAFDERLTPGYNPWFAQVLELRDLEVLGRKGGRPLGMIGALEPASFGR